MDLELNNKRVLVTGSNRGTGQVIAEAFADEGAEVFFHSPEVSDAPISAKGFSVFGDITTDEGANQVFDQVRTQTNHIDILVNNYGKATRGNWQSVNMDDWVDVYQINALSVVRMVQRFTPDMPAGSRIINLGTIGSTRPNTTMPHYYASKGALAMLTVSLAKEMGQQASR